MCKENNICLDIIRLVYYYYPTEILNNYLQGLFTRNDHIRKIMKANVITKTREKFPSFIYNQNDIIIILLIPEQSVIK